MSTVLDVTVCLLLVGVAVVTLATAVPGAGDEPSAPDGGDAAAAELGTVTASVSSDGATRHDTLAGHLARAAVANTTVGGEPVAATGYPDAAAEAVRNRSGDRTHVTARWRPLGDASVSGTVTAGRPPPRTADVSVTTFTVKSGLRPAIAASDPATSLANAYVAWLFPPERTRGLLVDSRTAPAAKEQYTEAAAALDTTVDAPLAEARTEAVNEQLSTALAERIKTVSEGHGDVDSLETPSEEVAVVVRRWEP